MATTAAEIKKEFFDLKDSDVARMLMGVASEVCQNALGVTVKYDIQIVDEKAKLPDSVVPALKRMTMVLSHVVERTGMTPEYIASMYGKTQPKGTQE